MRSRGPSLTLFHLSPHFSNPPPTTTQRSATRPAVSALDAIGARFGSTVPVFQQDIGRHAA